MNNKDTTIKYAITQAQLNEAVELLTTSLRHIPAFSMQLRADMCDTISALKNLAREPEMKVHGKNQGEENYTPRLSIAKQSTLSLGVRSQALQLTEAA